MALIKCKECGKDISDTAEVCINCGAKTEKAKRDNKNIVRSGIVILIIVLLASVMFAIYNHNPKIKVCNKAINILEKYRKDEIDTPKLINELKTLSNEAETLSKKARKSETQLDLSNISITLYLMSYEISDTYYYWNSHAETNDVKIDEYIKNIKKLKY